MGMAFERSFDSFGGSEVLIGLRRGNAGAQRRIGFASTIDAGADDAADDMAIHLSGEGHLLTIAPTGAGKGVGCIIPALLTYAGPMIVIDPKGENAAVTAERRRALGHQVHVIDPFGVSGLAPSRLNPLDLIDPNFADCVDDATLIARTITPQSSRDPFWENRAIQIIVGLILYACLHGDAEERNLAAVRELLHMATRRERPSLEFLTGATHPETQSAIAALKGTATTTSSGMLAVATDALDLFRGESLKNSLLTSSFELSAITRGDPLTVYLVLPPHLLQSHAPLLRLWLTTLFAPLARRRRRPALPTLILIDEAAQLGELDFFRVAMTLMRGYGVRIWSFWQDASQIKRLYEDWRSLINNCAVLQIFGASTPLAQQDASELLGAQGQIELSSLDANEMILSLSGARPEIVLRPNYLEDPVLSRLAAPNPFYQAGPCGAKWRRPSFIPRPPEVSDQPMLFPETQPPFLGGETEKAA